MVPLRNNIIVGGCVSDETYSLPCCHESRRLIDDQTRKMTVATVELSVIRNNNVLCWFACEQRCFKEQIM